MGKADFKKINDRWRGEDEMHNRAALNNFYDKAAQDLPSTDKKKVKTKTKKSNHKHEYQKVLIKYEDFYSLGIGRLCNICGKLICDRIGITKKTPDEYKDLPLINGGKFL